jgi:cytochrome c-type biogenesis protein CcmF
MNPDSSLVAGAASTPGINVLGGWVGEIFASLAFAGALVAAISFFMADRKQGREKSTWAVFGQIGFWSHLAGVLGIVATLFTLIYTHQYQYHYVWSHSSNELPVHFMISCFWEGQEGSFLLWIFWHAILGAVVVFTAKEWRNIVMSVLCSVNLILASMIQGAHVPDWMVKTFFTGALMGMGLYLLIKYVLQGREARSKGVFHLAFLLLATLATTSVWLGKDIVLDQGLDYLFSPAGAFTTGTLAFLVICVYLLMDFPFQGRKITPINGWEWTSGAAILILGIIALTTQQDAWKMGSTPFSLLRDAMPNAPVWKLNPNYVPKNGSGLNPLLQNYWMVIHPPTLFLGFAAITIPFAFVVGGLIRRQFTQWMRPAAPWLVFSVMVLGVGIIMGGYWAYETLNFGGYWNWDPVENGSLVPWLLGIAALHGLVIARLGKGFLLFTMIMVILTFLLVLYSTFLTRSGILGDTSVHTFTDLGLSGQLLLLLFIYFVGVVSLLVVRWMHIPAPKQDVPFKSAEFFIFLGTLVFIFSGIIITIATSIPVFNKIFEQNWGGIKEANFFYYRYLVYFAVGFGLFSAIGQFFFWRRVRQKTIRQALLRPFLFAMLSSAIVLIALAISGVEFSFEWRYREWLELAGLSQSPAKKILLYGKYILFVFSDEIMMAAALFTVAANLDMFITLLVKRRNTLKVTGGSLSHVGFGLMLLGILLSSGFESVVSKNLTPSELPRFSAGEQGDNVLLLRDRPRLVPAYNPKYEVIYRGKKEALPPISDIVVIEDDHDAFKFSFLDSTGDRFALVYPRQMFVAEGDTVIDLAKVAEFTNGQLTTLKPKLINERSLYGIEFVPVSYNNTLNTFDRKPEKSFTLYPEAEVNEGMGLIAHPARHISLSRDLYVHVSSIPKDEQEAPEYKYYRWMPTIGDTVQTARALVVVDSLFSDPVDGTEFDLIARLRLRVVTTDGREGIVEPLYRITKENRISLQDANEKVIHTTFAFTGINPTTGELELQAEELQNPVEDWIVLKAIKKPWINVLWLGTFVLVVGFMISIVRRAKEASKQRVADPNEAGDEDQQAQTQVEQSMPLRKPISTATGLQPEEEPELPSYMRDKDYWESKDPRDSQ